MSIALLHERLTQESKPTQPPVNQTSYAELDELAVPEFSRLFMPTPDSYVFEGPTVRTNAPEGQN